MKRLAGILLLLGASCQFETTTEDKRWLSLEGEKVYVEKGYQMRVHALETCPALTQSRSEVRLATVRKERLAVPDGTFLNTERERPPLCPQCVK